MVPIQKRAQQRALKIVSPTADFTALGLCALVLITTLSAINVQSVTSQTFSHVTQNPEVDEAETSATSDIADKGFETSTTSSRSTNNTGIMSDSPTDSITPDTSDDLPPCDGGFSISCTSSSMCMNDCASKSYCMSSTLQCMVCMACQENSADALEGPCWLPNICNVLELSSTTTLAHVSQSMAATSSVYTNIKSTGTSSNSKGTGVKQTYLIIVFSVLIVVSVTGTVYFATKIRRFTSDGTRALLQDEVTASQGDAAESTFLRTEAIEVTKFINQNENTLWGGTDPTEAPTFHIHSDSAMDQIIFANRSTNFTSNCTSEPNSIVGTRLRVRSHQPNTQHNSITCRDADLSNHTYDDENAILQGIGVVSGSSMV